MFIAKPPLYGIKKGNQQFYVEKESELDEYLLRDKLYNFSIADVSGKSSKLTTARWQLFSRKLR